jgi:TPR repeat protein
MAPNQLKPLKPLILGMLGMMLVAVAVSMFEGVRQLAVEEQRRGEANKRANRAMQQNRIQARAADENETPIRREKKPDALPKVIEVSREEQAALDALQAKKRPVDIGAAFDRLRRKAEAGDPEAQALLGFIFLHGLNKVISVDSRTYGVKTSTKHASALLGEDIRPRLADTRFVSIPYVPSDRPQGLYWYERAANQGHRGAQASLAAAHMGYATTLQGYKWALIATRVPWPDDYVSLDGHNVASVENFRFFMERENSPSSKDEARRLAEAFQPKKEKP